MMKPTAQSKPQSTAKPKLPSLLYVGALLFVTLLLAFAARSHVGPLFLTKPNASSSDNVVERLDTVGADDTLLRSHTDPAPKTFYDDPNLGYSIESRITDWDRKRRDWLHQHPGVVADGDQRVLLVTGSPPSKCRTPDGDYLLLRLFKNKVDYCRLHHGFEIFYNNAHLHPKMNSYWAKIPVIKAAMIAHPETEWIWWVDSDAVITDMDLKLPLERYKSSNLVVSGWPEALYKKRSWVGLNAGIFLIRNCQWSMDFMDVWADMGPRSPNYEKWGMRLKAALGDKPDTISDDQSALAYMLIEQKEKWGDMIRIETHRYGLQSYWLSVIDEFKKNFELEKKMSGQRRRNAEVMWERYAKGDRYGKRSFITHFAGCAPCSGHQNPAFVKNSCRDGMEIALNFADNQVLQNYGFGRSDLMNSSSLSHLPFDPPAF